MYTVKTADQSLQDATGFEALWKKNNPEIDLLSDTYARETSDYFCAQCGIDTKGQWAMLDTSFTNPVSYTHLDVYKRQTQGTWAEFKSFLKGKKDQFNKDPKLFRKEALKDL